MAFNGSGVFSRLYNWVNDAAAGIKIRADRMDAEFDGIATALSTCLLKDGTQVAAANQPYGGFKITGYGSSQTPNARTDVPQLGQVQDSDFIWGGTSGGSANAHTVSLTPAITAQKAGRQIEFIAGFTNTGAATLNANSIGAQAFRKMTAAGLVALTGGEIVAGNRVRCTDTGSVYILADIPEGTKGADIASATTTDLSAATGDYVDVTGTTTITGLGTAPAGVERTTHFTGALQLTHHATQLILPGAANITTAAGDVAKWRSLGSGNWRCVTFTRASGYAVATPSASESVAGIAELATQAETNAGSDDARIVTPLKLSTYVGTLASVPANAVINPEGFIFQRVAPTADNAYAWDRWRLLLGAANAATVSQLTSGLPTTAKNAMRLTVGSGNNNKFGIFQIIEGVNVYALRGKTVCLQAQMKATAGLSDIRMAIVEWTGTEDATSGDPIGNWQSAGTVPTYAAGWANLNTPANLSVTTSFAQYNVTATVGASATNLAVFIWSDDTSNTQTTDILDITQVVLTPGGSVVAYSPRQIAQERELCLRYCRVLGPAPFGANRLAPLAIGSATSSTEAEAGVFFGSMMRSAPTLAVSAAADFELYGADGTIACTAVGLHDSAPYGAAFTFTVAAGLTAGRGLIAQAVNGALSTARLTLSAEL